jgi:ABC-2 type transport system permease protein
VVSTAWSYASIYTTAAKRAQLGLLFGTNHAVIAIFGPTNDLGTVEGFTVFKASMTLMLVGAIWGLLLATRLLRGEEDAGRADLLLVGRVSSEGATAQVVSGLLGGVFALWVATTVGIVLVGHDHRVGFGVGASCFFALSLVAAALMFLVVGALTSQIASTRRQASSLAAVVLGVAYLLRMVADSSSSLEWMRWLSPLGWIEQLSPLTSPRALGLVPIAMFTLVLGALAVRLSGRRDVGAGLVADRSEAEARLRLLRSSLGLSARLVRGTVIGWWVAIGLAALAMGYVARSAGQAIQGGSVAQVFNRFGVRGSGAATYLGLAFLIVSVLVAFTAASQVAALGGEESERRLELLVSRPVSRIRWLSGRMLVALVAVVAAGLLAGLGSWVGGVLGGGGLSLTTLLAAGLNAAAPALCVLGISVVAVGFLPRLSTPIAWGIVAWSLIVEIVGGIGAISPSVLETSVFHHLAAAPAVSPDWAAVGVLAGIGAIGMVIGAAGFVRRDLGPS